MPVLISIKPKWCEKICHEIGKDETGKPIYEKRIEVRKSAPKEVPFKAYIYCTRITDKKHCSDEVDVGMWKGNEHVIGEFICDRIDRIKKRGINNNFDYCYLSLNEWGNDDIEIEIKDIQKSCIPKSELNAYGKNSFCLYAWHISDLKIYDKPKELSEFRKPLDRVWGSYCNDYCDRGCISFGSTDYSCNDYWNWEKGLTRPPQSWQYVEEVEE